MFYSHDILSRKGKYGIIWLAAKKGKLKKRDCLAVDIISVCKELIKSIPNGTPKHGSLKFSLYLLSELMYGVVRIYQSQESYFSEDVQALYLWFTRPPPKKKVDIDLPAKQNQARGRDITMADPLSYVGGFVTSPFSSFENGVFRSFDELEIMSFQPSEKSDEITDVPFTTRPEDITMNELDMSSILKQDEVAAELPPMTPADFEIMEQLSRGPQDELFQGLHIEQQPMDQQEQQPMDERPREEDQTVPGEGVPVEGESTLLEGAPIDQLPLEEETVQQPGEQPMEQVPEQIDDQLRKRRGHGDQEKLELPTLTDEEKEQRKRVVPRRRHRSSRFLIMDEQTHMSANELKQNQHYYQDTIISDVERELLLPVHLLDAVLSTKDSVDTHFAPKPCFRMSSLIINQYKQQCVKPHQERLEFLAVEPVFEEPIYIFEESVVVPEMAPEQQPMEQEPVQPQQDIEEGVERELGRGGRASELRASPLLQPLVEELIEEEIPPQEQESIEKARDDRRGKDSSIGTAGLLGRPSSGLLERSAGPYIDELGLGDLEPQLEPIAEQHETGTEEFARPLPPKRKHKESPVFVGKYELHKRQLYESVQTLSIEEPEDNGWVAFDKLCPTETATRTEAAKTFSLLLDLKKMREVEFRQSEPYDTIFIRPKATD